MDRLGRLSTANGLALTAAALTLSACTVATPASVTSVQSAPSAVSSLTFATQDEERGLRSRFKTALRTAFVDQDVAISEGAAYLADFAVSERPAELGLQDVTADETTAEAPKSDFEPHWYHSCKPHRVSASLVIYSKNSGTLHSKAQGEFLACPGDTAQLKNLAELLAARALQN